VLKSTGISGSLITVEVLQVYNVQRKSVVSVSTNLNAPNGALTTNDTEFGEDSLRNRERLSEPNGE
jgi:hypothetical protein